MIYEQQKLRIHQVLFVLCILFALFSPKANLEEVQAKPIREATGGMASRVAETVSDNRKTDKIQGGGLKTSNLQSSNSVGKIQSNTETRACDAICKINTLTGIGIREEIAISLVENCKALADDPRKCVIAGASIVASESSGGWNCRKNNKWNCFGIMQNNNYESYHDSTLHFAGKFQKWWRNAKSASFFYPSVGTYSPSRFCVSEHSSKSAIGCPNGQKNAQIVWDKLEKAF